MKKENKENEKSLKKVKEEKKSSKFFTKIKKKWLISGTNTLLLIAIIIAIFIFINVVVKKAEITPIDCTTSQDYTLTKESKERVSKIDKSVNIYFFGYEEENKDYDLAKQYHKANSKIKVELVDANKNVELAKKYEVSNEEKKVIVECEKTSRTLTEYDLINYDYETGKSVDIAEQKITSAIINVTAGNVPKVYYLTGYTQFELNTSLVGLSQYLDNEVLTYENLNILNKKGVPEDCDTLIIMTPNKDFDEFVADEIIKYIKKGGNILWFNGVYEEEKDYKNVNKVLEQYGINKFEKGIIYETDLNKILGYDTIFAPDIQNNSILKDVKQSAGTIFFSSTKINFDEEKAEKQNVQKTDLLLASEKSYFTKDLTGETNGKDDKKGTFVVGAELVKTISEAKEADGENEAKEAVTSKLIIYGNDLFITDYPIQIAQGYKQTILSIANNKDVVLNSIAYLVNNDQEITIRKSYSDSITTFTPTEGQKALIMRIIFAVPLVIIAIGIIIWIIRRRRQ